MESESSLGKWVGILGLIGTVAALILTLTLWFIDRSTSDLKFEVVSKAGLDPVLPVAVTGSVSVLLNGVIVRHPTYIVIDVVNSGSQSILPGSFERPIKVVAGSAIVESVQVIGKTPSSLSPVANVVDGELQISPLLLNPGDSFQLGILTSGADPSLAVSGRIAGIKDIALIDEASSKGDDFPARRLWAILLAGVAVACHVMWLTHWNPLRTRLGPGAELFGAKRSFRPSVIFAFGVITYCGSIALVEKEISSAMATNPWPLLGYCLVGMFVVFALARTILFRPR